MSNENQNLRCSVCGSPAAPEKNNDGIWVCPHCDARRPAPEEIPSDLCITLNVANTKRLTSHFGEALEIYDQVLKQNSDLEEANWGALVSEYGIEFVEEKGKFIPTVHRVNSIPVYKMPYYKYLQDDYKKMADEIEKVRLAVWQKAEKLPPYHVFICYKDKEENGRETIESKWARDIYEELKDLGLNVFYAPKVLASSNMEYEPQIYAALQSAKLMIVLVANKEHVNAPWVKNEWSRFAKFAKKKGEEKILRVMTSGIDPAELPTELRNRQIFDRDQKWEDAFRNSVRELFNSVPQIERKSYDGIKVGKKQAVKQTLEKRQFGIYTGTASISEATELENIKTLGLELGKYELTIQKCNNILTKNNACSEAYWIKLLAENTCKTEEDFVNKNEIKGLKTLEAAIATADKNRQNKIVKILHDKIRNTLNLELYEEYIKFPCVEESHFKDLTEYFYKQAIRNVNTHTFDSIIKTITEVDEFLRMHFGIIEALEKDGKRKNCKKIIGYLKEILNHDEGNKLALWKLYQMEHEFYEGSVNLAEYVFRMQNYAELEALYAYGYNQYVSEALMDICLKYATNEKQTTRLFDFILKLIPTDKNDDFIECIKNFIAVLFECGRYEDISKYNNQLLATDEFCYEAYFNRLLIKYKTKNLLFFLSMYDELLLEEDFNAAINAYGVKNSKGDNIYRTFYINLGKLLERLKSFSKETAKKYLDEFSEENKKAFLRNVELACRNEKSLKNKSLAEAEKILQENDQKIAIWVQPWKQYIKLLMETHCWELKEIGQIPEIPNHAGEKLKSWLSIRTTFIADLERKAIKLEEKTQKEKEEALERTIRVKKAKANATRKFIKVGAIVVSAFLAVVLAIFGITEFEKWRTGLVMQLSDDGTYYICTGVNVRGLLGLKEITIPSTHNNLPVKEVSDDAGWPDHLEKVTIPSSVTTIHDEAFNGLEELKTVIFSENSQLSVIGSSAFYMSDNLTSIVLPDSITYIGSSAFSYKLSGNVENGCRYLGSKSNPYLYLLRASTTMTELAINQNCKFIGNSAFANCDELTSITIPNSIISISSYAFFDCGKLKSVYIPSSVLSMGAYVFDDCSWQLHIYCEAESEPSEWDPEWNAKPAYSDFSVTWGHVM